MWSEPYIPDQSSGGSGPGDVLIRSTRALLPDPGHGPGQIQITVQKVRDDPLQQPHRRPDRPTLARAPAQPQPDRRWQQKPKQTKENRESRRRASADSSPHRKLRAETWRPGKDGCDLLKTRVVAGGRGEVLAALRQRKEVRVQLLDPGPPPSSFQHAPGPGSSSQHVSSQGFSSQHAPGPGSSSQRAPGPGFSSQNALDVWRVQSEEVLSSAAAPLIQCDLQARVCRLVDGVESLLQTEREGEGRGQSLNEHMLQTLFNHQLQLQSQLLQSALSMATGRDPATTSCPATTSDTATTSNPAMTSSLTAAGQLVRLQVTHLEPEGSAVSIQPPCFLTTRAASSETESVAMATNHCGRGPEQTRSYLQSSSNHSQVAASRANQMLREMGRPRIEMNDRRGSQWTAEKPPKPEPDPQFKTKPLQKNKYTSLSKSVQSPKNQIGQTLFKSIHSPKNQTLSSACDQNPAAPQQIQMQESQTHTNQSQTNTNQSKSPTNQSKTHTNQSKTHTNQSQTHTNQSQTHTNQSQTHTNQSKTHTNQSQTHTNQSQTHTNQSKTHTNQSKTHTNQSKNHTNQSQTHTNPSQKKRPQSPESPFQTCLSQEVQIKSVVPSVLEEAGQVLRQVRRQKRVLEENLEALLSANNEEVLHCQLDALAANRDWTQEVRIKKTVDAWISTLSRDIQMDLSSDGPAPCRAEEPIANKGAAVTSEHAAVGSTHTGVRRPVRALRQTRSKIATGSGSRGRTAGAGAESSKATGVLTDRKQVEEDDEAYLACLYGRAPYEGVRRTLKKSPYLRFSSPASPLSRKPRPRLVESVRGVKMKSSKTQTCLVPSLMLTSEQPRACDIISSSRMTSGDPADLTMTPAYPVAMAIPLGRTRVDSSRCHQEVTSHTAPPTSSVAAIEETSPVPQESLHLHADEAPSSPAPPSSIDISQRREEEDNEGKIFPGADFLAISDVLQQEEMSEVEEVFSLRGEEVLSVRGEEVLLDGSPPPPPVLYQGPEFPPQARDPLPPYEQPSIIGQERDELETRLFHWLQQQLMSRMISEMISNSDPVHIDDTDQSEHEPSMTSDIVEVAGGAGLQLFVDSSVSIDSVLIRELVVEVLNEHVALLLRTTEPGSEPEPEPAEQSGTQQEYLLVPTPVPTPPPSPSRPYREPPHLTTPPPSEPISLVLEEAPQPIREPECVATPTPSPDPAHSTEVVYQALPPLTWSSAELPLAEDRPEEHLGTHQQPLLVSVAQKECPLSSPPALPSPLPVRDDSPCSSSEDSSSSSSGCGAGTEALKPISEGELLGSINQLAAMTGAGAVCSFSSSLLELQEMDFDPPSEGQVSGHGLLLSLLTKMEQGVAERGERPQPEGSWGKEEEEELSLGEEREDWTTKPHRTTYQKSLKSSKAALLGQTSPPGEISEGFRLEVTNQDDLTPPTHTAGLAVPVTQLDTLTAERTQEEKKEVLEQQVECVSTAADSSVSDDF